MTVAELEEHVKILERRLADMESRLDAASTGKRRTFADLEGMWAHLPPVTDEELEEMKYKIPQKVWDAL